MFRMFSTALERKEKKKYRSKSMHLIKNPDFEKEFQEEFIENKEKSWCEKINEALLKYKEIKKLYKLTKIPPVYFVAVLSILLSILLIYLFFQNVSLSLATIYPLYKTFKTIQYYDKKDKKIRKEVIHWLKYWIIYGVLLNFETFFSFFFREFYTFLKIIIVISCFYDDSFILEWIYSIILSFFSKNETKLTDIFRNIWEHLIGENRNNNREGNNENIGEYINNQINAGANAINIFRNIVQN